ncbi:alpha/beta fold hydrolase [Salinisphaera sp. T31B1]|uniref:alpha/beta fold hydrolase n=1 Tax=Salinisphaera sp. T31B1 TaxID=727963 RepID=UPI0033411762
MNLHIVSQGTARADQHELVFIHGWGLSGRIWQSLIDRLSPRFRCHAVDLPGHGASKPGPVGLNNWADSLADTLAESVQKPTVCVGWSLGGLVTLSLARRHPERLAAAVLVASLPRMVRSRDWAWGLAPAAIEQTRQGLAGDYATTVSEFLMQQVLGEPGAARAVRSLRSDLIDQPPSRAGLERGLDILHDTDLRTALAALSLPTLWVAGARDRMAHPAGMDWAARQMTGAGYWPVERAAHAPFVSHERRFAERVTAFVDELARSRPQPAGEIRP